MMIPYGRQSISEADIDAVVSVLRSDFLTQGPMVPRFEAAVARYCGAAHAVAVNSATSALHIACLALDVAPGDLVWTSPITFVASANCALYCGAQVDFVDIDPKTFNLCPQKLEEKLVEAEGVGALPKLVIAVHMCGQSCDMVAIHSLSKRFGFRILEDASHAIGGAYQSQPIGDCRYSDIAVFSFHPVKIVTSGEGGVATTQDPILADRMRLLRSHGVTREAECLVNRPDGPWYYEQQELGFNYRLTDLQAALGLTQMARVDDFVARRHEIALRYDQLLSGLPLKLPYRAPDRRSSFHLYVVRLHSGDCPPHREVFEALRARGIGVNLHYMPVYLQPYYAQLGFRPGYCPEAERYYAEAITFPIYPGLLEAQQHTIAAAATAALQ